MQAYSHAFMRLDAKKCAYPKTDADQVHHDWQNLMVCPLHEIANELRHVGASSMNRSNPRGHAS